MITIRLQRRGRKNDPSFRVIVVDSKRAAKTGSYLEMVGSYDPRTDRVDLQAERIKHWMSHGATVSDTVHNLLISNNIIGGKKRNVLPRKTVARKDAEQTQTDAEEVSAEGAESAPAKPADAEVPEAAAAENIQEETAA